MKVEVTKQNNETTLSIVMENGDDKKTLASLLLAASGLRPINNDEESQNVSLLNAMISIRMITAEHDGFGNE